MTVPPTQPTPLVILGSTLRGLRAMRDYTQTDAAAGVTAAGTPLSGAALGNIERGASPGPRVEVVWALLTFYQIEPETAWNLLVGVRWV